MGGYWVYRYWKIVLLEQQVLRLWRNERLYLGAAVQELDALVRRFVNDPFAAFFLVKQAVEKQGVEVKVHLLRAQVRFGHDVCLFDPACRGYQYIVYNVQFASIL